MLLGLANVTLEEFHSVCTHGGKRILQTFSKRHAVRHLLSQQFKDSARLSVHGLSVFRHPQYLTP